MSTERLVFPLMPPGGGAATGAAVVVLPEPADLDVRSKKLFGQVAVLVGTALEREVTRRLAEANRAALYDLASHDQLTGLYNRHYLDDAALQMCARDDRGATPAVGALMIDVDHFKQINDAFGHPVGDEVLRRVAANVTAAVRAGDVPVRYGGEEFLVMLPDVQAVEAEAIAERIRWVVASSGNGGPATTVSVGVALRRRGESAGDLVQRADDAMYAAKAAGRDRVDLAV